LWIKWRWEESLGEKNDKVDQMGCGETIRYIFSTKCEHKLIRKHEYDNGNRKSRSQRRERSRREKVDRN
jgi:hypothetical protein